MKRLLTGALALIFSISASATTLNPVQLLNPVGSAVGQAPVSTGPTTPPTWGNVPATALASQAANTVIANGTGSAASPTAYAMPSCSGVGSAVTWLSGTGFGCNLLAVTYAPLASPTFTGSAAAAALNITGNFTPSQTNGIVGTTTNNNANAGSVGEYVSASATAISLTTATATNITSISLTAGDWDVSGVVFFHAASGTVPTAFVASISTTSGTGGAFGAVAQLTATFATGAAGSQIPTPVVRISVSSTTTVFLVGQSNFTVSTMTGDGFIRARRIR